MGIKTRTENGGEKILKDIASAIRDTMKEEKIAFENVKGVGVGVLGPVLEDGTVNKCVNLGGGIIKIEEELSALLNGVLVKAGNDAGIYGAGKRQLQKYHIFNCTERNSIAIVLVFQNVITLSVNLADNIMLGGYSETALSGVAAVNQVQFVFQQLVGALGDGLVIIGSQYWGKRQTEPMKIIAAAAMRNLL